MCGSIVVSSYKCFFFFSTAYQSPFFFQQNRILNGIKDQTEQILKLVFENYKSLEESSFSGIKDVVSSATGVPAPALAPAVKLYMLLHDVLSPEDKTNLCHYFQVKHTPSLLPYFTLG